MRDTPLFFTAVGAVGIGVGVGSGVPAGASLVIVFPLLVWIGQMERSAWMGRIAAARPAG
jgi:hypothetical protein